MPIKSFNLIGTQKHMIVFKINKSINCVLRLHAHQFHLDSIKITNPLLRRICFSRPTDGEKNLQYRFFFHTEIRLNECCNFNLRCKNSSHPIKIPFKCGVLTSKERKYVELLNVKTFRNIIRQ